MVIRPGQMQVEDEGPARPFGGTAMAAFLHEAGKEAVRDGGCRHPEFIEADTAARAVAIHGIASARAAHLAETAGDGAHQGADLGAQLL